MTFNGLFGNNITGPTESWTSIEESGVVFTPRGKYICSGTRLINASSMSLSTNKAQPNTVNKIYKQESETRRMKVLDSTLSSSTLNQYCIITVVIQACPIF